MAASPSLNAEKRHWWLTNRKVVDKYVKDARSLISTQQTSDVNAALSLLDSALALSPRFETALELKARSLLFLRRFREVADMLQDYIPSFKMIPDDDSSTSLASNDPSKEKAKLLSPNEGKAEGGDRSFRCFSVSDLKKKVVADCSRSCNREGSNGGKIL
ncbi:uncharacterized protein A4U43_C07F13160 [Asparagus officinalis]|uniref:Uncharacterized protein n=1 Tax=Asparagus officinalis TaxID=4686 RepID=A0A5P1EBS0_ASPOF|nr:uncharacterized protein A4U43_C07F13160 [Asparagus officinalis]